MRRNYYVGVQLAVLLAATVLGGKFVLAENITPEQVEDLQDEIQNRKAAIESINKKLEEYKSKIAEYSKKSSSLMNDVALLENEIALSELDIIATQTEIETQNLELQILDGNIADVEIRLARERNILEGLLFEMHKQDAQNSTLNVILGAKNFHEAFTAAAQLASVNSDLNKTLAATQQTRNKLDEQKFEREGKLGELLVLESKITEKIALLEERKNAKAVLAGETKESEIEYRVLLSELRQEQQAISARIANLQDEIEKKLAESDSLGDTSTISWPVVGRITTLFHDPTYPFRHLFEHSGLDIAVPQGTPIEASAGGYVAWARTGRQYGNYVMIIHSNGLATLYAHMSRIDVQQDQFVTRGDVIGLSGGRPGTPGAGFSTGPHLHFELRKNGIPVDPMGFLTD